MLQKSSARKGFSSEKSLAINRSSLLGEIRRFSMRLIVRAIGRDKTIVNVAIEIHLKQAEGVDYQSLPLGCFFVIFFLRAESCAEDFIWDCVSEFIVLLVLF